LLFIFAAAATILHKFWDQVISTATYIYDNQKKPWTMTTTFLIGMIDNKYNDHDATTAAFVDPCHMTKYDLSFPSSLFAERFFQSDHAPVCRQSPQQPSTTNWWRPIGLWKSLVGGFSNNNNKNADPTINLISRHEFVQAVQSWRDDERIALQKRLYEQVFWKRYWWSNKTVSTIPSTLSLSPEPILAKIKSVQKTSATKIRNWLIDLLKRYTTVPHYVWDLMRVAESIWQWRLVIQALSLFVQVSKATHLPVWLIFKAIFATGRAFNVPQKVFAATCPMLHFGCRLAALGWDFWVVYPYLKAFGKVVQELRRARTFADFFRALATGAWTSFTTWLSRALRGILLRVAAMMILPFLLYLMFHL
jgi:hypothetical protein